MVSMLGRWDLRVINGSSTLKIKITAGNEILSTSLPHTNVNENPTSVCFIQFVVWFSLSLAPGAFPKPGASMWHFSDRYPISVSHHTNQRFSIR